MGEKELYNQTPSILITLLELVMMSYVDFFFLLVDTTTASGVTIK